MNFWWLENGHPLRLGFRPKDHELQVIYTSTDENTEEYLSYTLRHSPRVASDLHGTLKGRALYDLLMRNFLKEQLGIDVPDLVEKWSQQC